MIHTFHKRKIAIYANIYVLFSFYFFQKKKKNTHWETVKGRKMCLSIRPPVKKKDTHLLFGSVFIHSLIKTFPNAAGAECLKGNLSHAKQELKIITD